MKVFRKSALAGLVGAVILLTACMSLLIAQAMQVPEVALATDQAAPELDIRDSSGKIVSLADLRGRVVVLFFSSADCPFSAAYADRMGALVNRYSADRIAFFRVEAQSAKSSGTPCPELQRLPIATLYDHDGALADRYSVRVTPSFFVIGPRGMLRYSGAFDDNREAGKVKIEYCRNAIQSLLDNEAVATTSTAAFGSELAPRPR